MPRRKRPAAELTPTRRSTNACFRCKTHKIKCFFHDATSLGTCAACVKSGSSCDFAVRPDGIPRGPDHVAFLESRIASLEERLQNAEGHTLTYTATPPHTINATSASNSAVVAVQGQLTSPSAVSQGTVATDVFPHAQRKIIETASDGVTIFNFLFHPVNTAAQQPGSLAELPSPEAANFLLETSFAYTQARYCVADWVRIRAWFRQWQTVCLASSSDDADLQTGAYFLWMTFAIGAQTEPDSRHPPDKYYQRALGHLPVILSQQNLTAVQALLVLIQYFYRAESGPSGWHLVGTVMRLCIELGLHKPPPPRAVTLDPYALELRKRLFWCAYCFDRSMSILCKRPFAIEDFNVDVEFPVEVDVECTDYEVIRHAQSMQAAGQPVTREGNTTTITASLYHLQIYHLQSRIVSRFRGCHSPPWTREEVFSYLAELQDWRERASSQQLNASVPQQTHDIIQGVYYQASLLLMRNIFTQQNIDPDLLQRCAELAAEACENQKLLCFKPQTQNSPIRTYNCFRCGLTLLQCLSVQPKAISKRRALRAITSCSSALAVYTGALAVARPYLRLFETLSDHFLAYDEDETPKSSNEELRCLLHRVTSCDPSEIPRLLDKLSENELDLDDAGSAHNTDTGLMRYNLQSWEDPSADLSASLIMPFELLDESIRPDAFGQDLIGFWAGSSSI